MSNKISPLCARLLLLCIALLFASALTFAQSQASTGDIEGRVLDPNGAAVPNASITAKNKETGLERTVNSDEEGNFRIVLLPPGPYTVSVKAPGFAVPAVNAIVTVGGKATLDITLQVQGLGDEVTVTDEAQAVETSRTSVATTINQRSIDNLPINGRN